MAIRWNVNPSEVLSDVEEEIVSREEAQSIYGVEIEGENPTLNPPATETRRAALRKQRLKKRHEPSTAREFRSRERERC